MSPGTAWAIDRMRHAIRSRIHDSSIQARSSACRTALEGTQCAAETEQADCARPFPIKEVRRLKNAEYQYRKLTYRRQE